MISLCCDLISRSFYTHQSAHHVMQGSLTIWREREGTFKLKDAPMKVLFTVLKLIGTNLYTRHTAFLCTAFQLSVNQNLIKEHQNTVCFRSVKSRHILARRNNFS